MITKKNILSGRGKLKNNNLFNIIFIYFMITIVSAFCFLLFTNTYYLSVLQEKTQEQYTHRLDSLSTELDAMFDEILSTTTVFTYSDDLQEILATHNTLINHDYTILIGSIDALKAFRQTKSYIHSVFVVSKINDIVLSNYGSGQIDEFFESLVNYADYNSDFWQAQDYSGQKFKILPPSDITHITYPEPVRVIPIVQFVADRFKLVSPIVINVKESHIVNLLNDIKLSENSIIFQYSSNGVISRSSTDPNHQLKFNNQELILLAEKHAASTTDTFKFEGNKYLIVTHKSSHTGNTVCAITPYSDLRSESMSIFLIPMAIFLIGITVVTILSFLLSRRLYRPIHNVALHLRENYMSEVEINENNDLDFLSQSVQLIISDVVKLKEELSLAIPYVCERYLLSLFDDDNSTLQDEEVIHFLAQYDFSFPHSTFVVVQSILNFKEGFYETHSKAEYNAICQGNIIIANDSFSDIENRYVFSPAINQICVILNLPDDYNKNHITKSIIKYHESLDIDDAMMIVHSGVGRLYRSLNGLKKSYKEALQARSQITYLTNSMIRTYTQSDDILSTSHYSIDEENRLINFLLQGNMTQTIQHYDEIISQNTQQHIGDHALKELYLQLYNTAIRVINRRNLNIYDMMGANYINISSHVGDLHPNELYNYIKKVFECTISQCSKTNAVSDLTNLKHYLDTHFTDEIYLDSLAEYFDKSANYMSKYIKKTLGVPFQDYIAALRINKSKDLLITTHLSVVAISAEVGFNSRHPFIRKFKMLEGVTPTQYRKLHKSS